MASLECGDLSPLWSVATCCGHLVVEASGRPRASSRPGQSGDRSPHSKELTLPITARLPIWARRARRHFRKAIARRQSVLAAHDAGATERKKLQARERQKRCDQTSLHVGAAPADSTSDFQTLQSLLLKDSAGRFVEENAGEAFNHSFNRAATSKCNHRTAGRVYFQRHHAEIFFTRKQQRAAAAGVVIHLAVRLASQKFSLWSSKFFESLAVRTVTDDHQPAAQVACKLRLPDRFACKEPGATARGSNRQSATTSESDRHRSAAE